MDVRFSVIIPIFNAAAYLRDCIDSVLDQTYDNYEIILINDGSTDNSLEICREYESKNDKIIVLTKQNEGLSATRNLGLDVCKGDYIVFLDSDDYIEADALLQFKKVIDDTGAEVILGYTWCVVPDGSKKKSRPFLQGVEHPVSGKEFFTRSLYQNNLCVGAQCYIYCKDFIEKEGLRFKAGIYHEDELWTPIVLSRAVAVVDLKYCFYNYRTANEQSITRDPSKASKRALDRITVARELSSYFSKCTGREFNSFKDNIAAQYMYAVYDGDFVNNMEINIDRFFPLRHARTFKYIMKSLVFAVSPALACKGRNLKRRK